MSEGRRVVADERHLRIALRQQLLHNEQQNLAMTRMTADFNRANKLIANIKKSARKVDAGTLTADDFLSSVLDLMSKFEATNARGTGAFKSNSSTPATRGSSRSTGRGGIG